MPLYSSPSRTWPYLLGFILTVLAFAATSIVALGAPESSWWIWSLDAWLVFTVGTVVAIVLFSLAKDIVDNDVDTGATDGGPADGPPPTMPDRPAKAAGS